MSILEELNTLLSPAIPIETGVFSNTAPSEYIVLTPLSDSFDLFCDNKPEIDICEVRISIFSKENYMKLKRKILKLLIENDFTVTDRRYSGYSSEYYHYSIDVSKQYETEDY